MKKHKKTQVAERPLAERIANSRQEGKTQQALDLMRQLAKQQPSEAHQELLRQVTLERGQHLQSQGQTKDAATVYTNLLSMGGAPEFQTTVAERLASCGAVPQTLAIMTQLPDPAARQKVLCQAVDAALTHGAAGKTQLPAELQGPFELIVQAFAHAEAGRDEEARAALQGIGLQSPFLEWKVLMRGLLAYYGNDDARALENWQRLDPNRMPYRISAPLRASIDPAFMKAQPAATQKALQAKLQQQSGTFAPILRDLGKMLAKDDLAPAFRKAEQAIGLMRRSSGLGHSFSPLLLLGHS